jgi:hypothetical protein
MSSHAWCIFSGRVPLRNGIWSNASTHLTTFGVDATGGLPISEVTFAAALTTHRSLAVGKWVSVFSVELANRTGSNVVSNAVCFAALCTACYYVIILMHNYQHLGQMSKYLPTAHGFDHYVGIPYCHNQCPCPTDQPNVECYNPPGVAVSGVLVYQLIPIHTITDLSLSTLCAYFEPPLGTQQPLGTQP